VINVWYTSCFMPHLESGSGVEVDPGEVHRVRFREMCTVLRDLQKVILSAKQGLETYSRRGWLERLRRYGEKHDLLMQLEGRVHKFISTLADGEPPETPQEAQCVRELVQSIAEEITKAPTAGWNNKLQQECRRQVDSIFSMLSR
jgi:hypothetical protein